ncbi:endo alpha-1,4 polygalactosaminidase [Catenulispora pinisilvae]|uniref:endo alpha-1,4 polygalactosaminidase n=1 Tax=Catenulispora pinisilvae TaxID=2705253 RepID=UPI00189278EB|nr:endo alpha-1,4 polygalactosaminidase [Catenulispora pinisilvae]
MFLTPSAKRLASAAAGLALAAATTAVLAPSAGAAPSAATATRSASATPTPPSPVSCSDCWQPDVQTSWNWVISTVPTAPYRNVQMYDVDGFNNTAANVSALHAAGIKAVCYLSAGTYENWRPDASQFPSSVLGSGNGWPGEKWLDIREIQKSNSVLRTIMDARLDMCRQKGFDMVELDNVDGYTNSTGFPLTAADQLYFNATLANDAHSRGLSVLQKNDDEQIPQLLPYFDGALNEQCNQYKECTTAQNGDYGYDQYVAAGKPVFQAEYNLATSKFCSADNTNDFNGVRFDLNLDDKTFEPCR